MATAFGSSASSSFRSRSCAIVTTAAAASATTAAEDLDLTRQVILNHISSSTEDSTTTTTTTPAPTSSGISFARKSHYDTPSPPSPDNDLMMRAALSKDEPVPRTPVWLFRQAGRHLPEYQEYKRVTGRNFLEMLGVPEDVAECTMQPLRRYDVDAAILFSDILVIAQALEVDVTMPGGVGILVPNPLAGPEEVAHRIPPLEDMTPDYVEEHLGHVLESVRQIRAKMEQEGKSVPLIGFSAAPWTLMFYMVGGSSRKNNDIGMKWLREHPEESTVLLQTLTKIVVEYMTKQVEHGAHMLQVFEAMGMMIDQDNFYKYAMPCLKDIATELKARFPNVPLMVFARGACFANEELSKVGYDVVTMDGSVARDTARATVGDRAALQGNYDPRELVEVDDDGNRHTAETVRRTVRELLQQLGPQRLIANLGEGLGGKESPELVKAFVDAVHQESEKMIADAAAAAAAAE